MQHSQVHKACTHASLQHESNQAPPPSPPYVRDLTQKKHTDSLDGGHPISVMPELPFQRV